MLRILACILGVFMTIGSVAQAAQGADAARITRLKNGLTVYVLKDDRFPLVSTRLYVHAGSAYETAGEAGISHLLEHMVFKGTDRRPKGAVARDVEAAGGYLNAATSFDYTVYLTDLPAAHWKLGMDVVKDMAFHATLDPAELAAEKEVVLSELQRGEDSPGSRIFKALQASSLKGTPYERPIIGYVDTIKAITAEDMRAYIAKYYQPQGMLLVVVGNVDPAAVLEEAQNLFGSLPNTADMTPRRPIDPRTLGHGPAVTVQPGPWNKVYLGAALPVPGDADVRSIPLDVLSYLLGGDATSYLYRKYKYEKQLVDNISVGNYTFERVGMLYVTAELDADKVERFWKEFTADMASLKADRFTEEELARARLNLEDGIQRTKETLSGLASWKGRLQFFLGGEQGEENMLTELRNVNHAQLQYALDTWVMPERLSVAVLPPRDARLPDLAALSAASWPSGAPKAATEAAAVKSGVETVDLGHGRTLVLIPDATMPYTAVDLYMPGGDALLPPEKQGLAALTARVLTSGTKGRSAPDTERYLSNRAASLSATAGRQVFGLSMREPSRFNKELFAMFRDTLTEPAFAREEVEREKNSQIAAIRARDDQPLGLAFAALPPFLFPGGHPYGYRVMGTVKDVEKYGVGDISGFWEQQARQPWVLAVAGDFDREQVLEFARSLPVPKNKGVRVDAPLWGKKKELDLSLPGRNQAHLMLVFKTVPVTDGDAPGLELLQNVLSGQSGLLFRELRDVQGLGYTVTAFNRLSQKAGYMVFYIGTEPGKVAQAEEGFRKILGELRDKPLPEAELVSGRNQMEGDYYRERQSLGSRAGEAASLSVLGYPLDFRRLQIDKAKALTPADLQKLARKYLIPEQAYVVKVLP